MKKLISIAIGLILALSCYCVFANDNDLIQDGTYVQMGSYRGEPILWRCVSTSADDENGKLILSDKILCYKCFDSPRIDESLEWWMSQDYQFGNGYWKTSNIRTWLNSTASAGEVDWSSGSVPNSDNSVKIPYDTEAGFLSSDNFSASELAAIKSVSQWQILACYHKDEVTNGIENFYETNINYSSNQFETFHYNYISELSHVEGGMCRLTDTMFFIDEIQAYKLWQKYDTYAQPTDSAVAEYDPVYSQYPLSYDTETYWLRTQRGYDTAHCIKGSDRYTYEAASFAKGVRPAFYLNEDNVRVISGSGEWNDPYVIDGYEEYGTTVFVNGQEAQLDSGVAVENDEILVPMRSVYEALGADVEYYDEEDQIITATLDGTTVVMQIDNPEMGNGTDVIDLDIAPQIINDIAMVSLQAIEASFDAEATIIPSLDRIVIENRMTQYFDDSYGKENWQIKRAKENGTYNQNDYNARFVDPYTAD